ncbi:MAG: GntR family transcriptional regulator [Pseudomonadota bacterium]|nr:GntR family transcriptional regulator [Pseudomonadota bacterium]
MSAALRTDVDRPLYLQLLDALRRDIAQKRPGERIDSEPVLAERFGVSRFTVTRAVEILVDEGLIHRRQGLGSFVAPPPLRRRPSYLASFTEAVESQGRASTQRLLAFGPQSWREDLPYPPEEPLIRFDRLRLVDAIPTAIHCSVLPADLARKISLDRKLAASPRVSLYRLFTQAGLVVARGVETLRARSAEPEERRLLELGDHPVVMEVTRSTYDSGGALLDFVHAVYDARRYAYQAEIRSAALGGQSGKTEEETNERLSNLGHAFGPRLGPWGDDDGERGGKAGRPHHRAGRSRRSVL